MKKLIIILGMIVCGAMTVVAEEDTAGQNTLVEEFERLNAKKKLTNEEYERFVDLSGKIEVKEAAKEKFQKKFEGRFVKKTRFSEYLKEEFLHPSRSMEIFECLAVIGLAVFLLFKWWAA
ncbi:MAG: hypothetical protein WC614_02090 [bacterium]